MNFLKGSRAQGLVALCGVRECIGVPEQAEEATHRTGRERETGSREIALKKLQLLFYSLIIGFCKFLHLIFFRCVSRKQSPRIASGFIPL